MRVNVVLRQLRPYRVPIVLGLCIGIGAMQALGALVASSSRTDMDLTELSPAAKKALDAFLAAYPDNNR